MEPFQRRLPPPDDELAYRFKESTFRLYEPYIARALLDWPIPVAINPAPLRATTFAARLRDAILRLRLYVTTTTVDLELFDRLAEQLVVVHRDQAVAIGPRGTPGRSPGAVIATHKTAVGFHWENSEYSDNDVRMVVALLGRRLIVGPVYLRPLDPTFQNELETTFDCAIQTLETHSIIL